MSGWTPEIVRARFVEACDTERRMPTARIKSAMGYWPSFEYSFEDQVGWGKERLAAEREMRFRRIPPTSAAITRHEEVMHWTATLIDNERDRHIVWAWAWCRLTGSSFSARCRKFEWVKMTAYRRLHAVSDAISRNLVNDLVLLRVPDDKWVLPEQPVSSSNFDRLALSDDGEPPVSQTHWKDDEAIEDRPDHRDFAWAQSQVRREAKRRRKLGLDAA